ncbi:hypothetical protein Tco_0933304 [Tanacetum coccineum]
MIGTLLYLTASRPDLQFAICMCAQYQARPTGMNRICKKKGKNKQNRARNGEDQVKSKSKVIQVKKIQLKGRKLPKA